MTVRSREWRWLAGATFAIFVATLIPPTVGRVLGPEDRVHVGTYWYAGDFTQYAGAMREAAKAPSWLTHDHLSAEPHDPVLIYPLYATIGKLAAATGFPLMGVYAAVEILMRLVVPISVYVFVATFLPQGGDRRLGFVLAAFSGGVELWLALGKSAVGVGPSGPSDLEPVGGFIEAVTFGAFLAAPHVGFGLAATLTGLVCFRSASQGSPLGLVLLGVDVLALASVHPFNLPVLLATFGVYTGFETLVKGKICFWPMVACLVAAVAGGPLLLYNFVTFTFVPFWSETYGAQNLMPSPRPWELPARYGVVLVLAAVGVVATRRAGVGPLTLLLTWLCIGGLAMYAPVPYQRRFGFGLQPALAVLAAYGWPAAQRGVLALVGRLRVPEARRAALARRLVAYPLLLFGFQGMVVSYLAVTVAAASNYPVAIYMVDRDTYALGEWLAERSGPGDVVLGSFNTGNVLGGVIPGRVVLGHEPGTARAREKKAAVEALYRGELAPEDLRRLLADNRVSYLIVGPEERKLGPYDPGSALGLPIAVRIGQAVAYAVANSPVLSR